MSDTGAPRPVSPVLANATNAKDRTLLLADDDAAFRNRIARALELRGFIVTAVGSVAEALAQTARPPGLRRARSAAGRRQRLELVGPLRQARPDIRIVVLTGYGNIATAVAAVKEGAVDYLAKPADADAIEQALNAHGRKLPPPPSQSHVGRPGALGTHPAGLRAVRSQRLGDGAPAQHAPRTLQRILGKHAPQRALVILE
jgi:two-component system response regulator RegA